MGRCFLSNCRNYARDAKLFTLPFKNMKLLKQWLVVIPKDLYTVIENPSYICENHFEMKFIQLYNGRKRLDPKAVPSIFSSSGKSKTKRVQTKMPKHLTHNSNCRFCLKQFKEDEKQIDINSYIKKQFFVITQTELKSSEVYSQSICESCFEISRDLAAFRTQLIQNQKSLEKAFEGLEESKFEEDFAAAKTCKTEDNSYSYNEEVLVKVEPLDLDDFNFLAEIKQHEDASDTQSDHIWPDNLESQESFSDQADDIPITSTKEKTLEKALAPENLSNHKDESVLLHQKSSSQKEKMCDICGTWFKAMSFRRHYDRMHLKIKDYCCDICGFRVFKKFDIGNHIKSHFKIKTHSCDKCPLFFTTTTGLRTHRLVHKNDRNFKCDMDFCTAAFKSKEGLKRHINSHLRLRMHECVDCLRKFTDTYKLKRHRISAHVPDPTELTPCPVCAKVFKTPRLMKKHLIYHEPPEISCKICSKQFYKPINLKAHMRSTHGGSKDFQCKYCDSSYFKNTHLNRHILTSHMKQKIFCQVKGCQQHFPRKERYKVHILAHHQQLGEKQVNKLIEGIKTVEVTYESNEYELNLPQYDR